MSETDVAFLIGPACVNLASRVEDCLGLSCILHPGDLYRAAPEILERRPRLLFLDSGQLTDGDLGALRLIARLQPALKVVLVRPAGARPGSSTADFEGFGFAHLESPATPAALRALLCGQPGAAVAHEHLLRGLADHLGNPLAALAGRLQLARLLLEEGKTADAREQLTFALAAGKRLEAVLAKLGELAGKARPVPVVVPLRRVLRAAWEALPPGLPVPSPAPPGGPRVRVDPDLTARALAAVWSVAAALVPPNRPPSVAWNEGTPGLRILLPEPVPTPCPLDRVLEPFRLDPRLRLPDAGLDLGLAARLLEAQGGRLEPLAAGGRLSGFRLVLPPAGPPAASEGADLQH